MRNVYELTNSASASYRKALRLLLILFVDRKFSVILGVLLFQLSRKQSAIRVCGHQKHAPVTRNPCHVTPPARWIHARHPVWTKTGKAWTWPWTSNILFKQATSHTHTLIASCSWHSLVIAAVGGAEPPRFPFLRLLGFLFSSWPAPRSTLSTSV